MPNKTHLFFLSYARFDVDEYLDRFYDDLVREVRGLSKDFVDTQMIGFRDSADIFPGDNWRQSLIDALRTARVFIYLISPVYFSRKWCGKEWAAFEMRLHEYIKGKNPQRPPLMCPVLWRPTPELPRCATEIQFTHRELGEIYSSEGLRYLVKLNRYKDDYEIFLTQFSKRIVDVAKSYVLPEFGPLPPVKEIANAFKVSAPHAETTSAAKLSAGPRYAQFIYVAGKKGELQDVRDDIAAYGEEGGGDWKPYLPACCDEVMILTQEIATNEKFRHEVIALDENLIENIRSAREKNKIVIILIDPWTVRLGPYSSVLRKYDKLQSYNCALLVLFNHEDEETNDQMPLLRLAVKDVLINKSLDKNPASFRDDVGSLDAFSVELVDALRKVRERIRRASERFRRVRDEVYLSAPTISASGVGRS
ncbi:MAG: TIR domain-containing protein [bacterium]|nr:TIR domain-containing protein [bacterium]